MGEAVQQRSGEAFRAEDLGPFVEGQVGGDQDGVPFVALAKDLEEEFRTGGGQGHEPQLIDDQQAEAEQLPLQVEQTSFVPGPPSVRFTAAFYNRRDAPARSPSRCTSPTWRGWTAGPAAWSRTAAVLAGNSPVYGPGWKSPPFVPERVAGKPGLFLPGRKLYFCPFQPGGSGMTLYGYARVSVREPEDKNLDLQVERLVRAPAAPWAIFEPRKPAGPGTTAAAFWNCWTWWSRETP